MSEETCTPWDSAEFLDDDEARIEYLKAALAENDPEFFAKSVGNVARAMGMTTVAREARLGRPSLYKSLALVIQADREVAREDVSGSAVIREPITVRRYSFSFCGNE